MLNWFLIAYSTICIFFAKVYTFAAKLYPSKENCFANVWSEDEEKKAYRLLKDVSKCMDRACLKHYICFGSLLGCMRGKKIIPHDDDIDLCYVADCENNTHVESLQTALLYMRQQKIECITVREGLVGKPYLRVFYSDSRKIPFLQGKFPYIDLFESRSDDKTGTTFIWPSGKRAFDTTSLFPLKLRRFGPLLVNTPYDPHQHLQSEYGKKAGYMNTVVGTNFNHNMQIPSLCYKVQDTLENVEKMNKNAKLKN